MCFGEHGASVAGTLERLLRYCGRNASDTALLAVSPCAVTVPLPLFCAFVWLGFELLCDLRLENLVQNLLHQPGQAVVS